MVKEKQKEFFLLLYPTIFVTKGQHIGILNDYIIFDIKILKILAVLEYVQEFIEGQSCLTAELEVVMGEFFVF